MWSKQEWPHHRKFGAFPLEEAMELHGHLRMLEELKPNTAPPYESITIDRERGYSGRYKAQARRFI